LFDIKAKAVESIRLFYPYISFLCLSWFATYCDGTTGPNVTKTTQVGANYGKDTNNQSMSIKIYMAVTYISNNGDNYDGSFTPSTGESNHSTYANNGVLWKLPHKWEL